MTTGDPQFEGVYGPYTITSIDRREVQRYRISLLVAGLAMTAGLVHWWQFGDRWAWVWLVPLMAGLGLALHWIHIYLRPLHNALRLFWLTGCLGWGLLLMQAGPNEALTTLVEQPLWILAIGPLFAALAGIGFKEFFCFQRPEAIGLTLLLPIALLGRLVGIISTSLCAAFLLIAGLLMVLLALRKFGMEAAADVGDKSVFAYLDSQRPASTP
ncbi:MAG: DUF2301 domain-containing membrane protein [Parasynechococcus sp.]|jgi:uncharacterized integral membrane protein|uniref:DUF2301 domain-containing membrane protein n=1 Tax=Parasynechococcus sp. TaxID=3101203 RepID=UPI000E15E015|nr:DUF2301 domain-containing membrane protein [Synechococcus sp. AH-601-J22]RCL56504.1 MAG: hypothetical protein DBW83_08110 [Synechococcus sp. MED-G69]|tara:strand:- start:1547 stop:2185 length:639 start_codon:yes stop_codon:yes gene_type:complete